MFGGPFVHQIDPVIWGIGGVYLWFYGLSYALGFLELHVWCHRRLGLTAREVLNLSLLFSAGVLIGARCVEVLFYEWAHYREHPGQIPAIWLGGMATHGK